MARPQFVGREQELHKLHEFLAQAANGTTQLCFITGEAGSGKTSLVNKFVESAIEAQSTALAVIGECNCQIGITDPYLPFREVLTLLTGEGEARLSQKRISEVNSKRIQNILATSLEILLDLGPDLIGPFIPGGKLLARATQLLTAKSKMLDKLKQQTENPLAKSVEISRERVFEQYSNFINRIGAEHLLIIILDDLHWADNASIALLFHLARRIQSGRILIIGTYRPNDVALGRDGHRHPLESVVNEVRRYKGDIWIELTTNDALAGRRFVDGVINLEPNFLNEAFRTSLYKLTEGNALFVVEFLRNLKERGDLVKNPEGRWIESPQISWKTLPTRVEGVIEERLSRLEAQLREALSVASIEGENFTAQVISRLQQVSEHKVLTSLSQELDKRHQLVAEDSEVKLGSRMLSIYRFTHSLFQQFVYDELSLGTRRLLHRQVAEALEELYTNQTDDIAAQLARHYEEAAVLEKAGAYLSIAADRALRISAFNEAKSLIQRAIGFQALPAELQVVLQRLLGITHYGQGDLASAKQCLEASSSLAQSHGDIPGQAVSLSRLGRVLVDLGDFTYANEVLTEALAVARAQNDQGLTGRVLNEVGYLKWSTGDLPTAKKLYEESLLIAQTLGNVVAIPRLLYDLGCCYHLLDDFPQAKRILQESLDTAAKAGDRDVLAYSHNELGWTLYDAGDPDEALRQFQKALVIAQEISNKWTTSEAHNGLGFVLVGRGAYSEAEDHLRQALQVSASIQAITEILLVLVGFATLLEKLGRLEQSAELIGLCFGHPGSDSEIKHFARQTHAMLSLRLSPDKLNEFIQRGQGLDLEATVKLVLIRPKVAEASSENKA